MIIAVLPAKIIEAGKGDQVCAGAISACACDPGRRFLVL